MVVNFLFVDSCETKENTFFPFLFFSALILINAAKKKNSNIKQMKNQINYTKTIRSTGAKILFQTENSTVGDDVGQWSGTP